jgi:probable F420-dependent oxidoreductase
VTDTTYELPENLQKLKGTIGLWSPTADLTPAKETGGIALRAEQAGFSALWIPEAWGREAFVNSSLLLGGASKIVIATGIANIWGRDPVAAAAASKTLNAAYDDRFVLGLGVSHQPLVEGLRGHQYVGPVAAMRAYLSAMQAAPNFSAEGRLRTSTVIAALGPKMLETGAELADGVHPYLVTPEHTAVARAAVGPTKFVGVEQAVVLGQSRDEFLARAHAYLEIYTGLDNYRNSWRRLGFTDEDFVRGGSERLCDALVIHGDESVILEKTKEHFEAGADHVCLQFLNGDMRATPFEDWDRVGKAINP